MGCARDKGTYCAIVNTAPLSLYKTALTWYVDVGWDIALAQEPWDCFAVNLPLAREKDTNPKPTSPPLKLQTLEDVLTLEDLREALEGFEECSLPKTATRIVFGEGAIGAPVMVIGDAPAEEEDRSGQPFVGEAGQLLDKILACIGLSRADTYMTYAINWRPPGGRTPTRAEMDSVKPFLLRHIALVAPKVVIAMGSVAANMTLGHGPTLAALRGTWHKHGAILVRATYSPTFLLRNPAQKRAVWTDMLAVQESLGL